VEAASSKACYLHGSFGAEKSHFMALLHLPLEHNTAVRSILELGFVQAGRTPHHFSADVSKP
jgi:hypothetical protein